MQSKATTPCYFFWIIEIKGQTFPAYALKETTLVYNPRTEQEKKALHCQQTLIENRLLLYLPVLHQQLPGLK